MSATVEREIFRQDAKAGGKLLTPAERAQLLAPYLPKPHTAVADSKQAGRKIIGVRAFFKNQLHLFVFALIHTFFSIYIRLRQAWHAVRDRVFAVLYYHHRTPELIQKDVKGLKRIPEHLSVILKLEEGGKGGASLEQLVDEVAEIAAWCACAGIPMLSVYERTGVLKGYIPATHRAVSRKLSSYFGSTHPALSIRAPHIPSMESAPVAPSHNSASGRPSSPTPIDQLQILLISAEDGRDSLVDLTKTLAEMAQKGKISSEDVTAELVNAELSESVMDEPQLLVLFGPSVELDGYPPWQVRLTEIYNVQDNNGVGYQVFLRALYNFADAQMRFGR